MLSLALITIEFTGAKPGGNSGLCYVSTQATLVTIGSHEMVGRNCMNNGNIEMVGRNCMNPGQYEQHAGLPNSMDIKRS